MNKVNAGRFPARLSPNTLMLEEEKDRANTSMPPNPVIANVMYIGGLIKHWGRGLSMMAKECERVGLPTPRYSNNGITVTIVFTRPKNASNDVSNDVSNDAGKSVGLIGSKTKDII